MRDYILTSIPDITQRFPEGFGGVDMTPGRYKDDFEMWDEVDRIDRIVSEKCSGCEYAYKCDDYNSGFYDRCKKDVR